MHFIVLLSQDRMDDMVVIFFTTVAVITPVAIGWAYLANWWQKRKK